MSSFTFNVPFFEFNENLQDNVANTEAFFEVEHANHNGVSQKESNILTNKEVEMDEKFYSVSPQDPTNSRYKMRRSISVGNLDLDKLKQKDNDIQNINNGLEALDNIESLYISKSTAKPKSHTMTTRRDAQRLTFRSRTISREALHKLAEQKPPNTDRYVSMAEAISQFHQKTPSRFHSQPKSHINQFMKQTGRIASTIPHSPTLTTKFRVRSVSTLSSEEMEMKQLEDAKKFHIKANPLNPKILSGALVLKSSSMIKKPPTKLEPFNLTEIPVKKVVQNSPKRISEFHAKPVPKSAMEPFQPVIKNALFTVPHTPKFMRRMTTYKPKVPVIESKDVGLEVTKPLSITKPMPFSFEQRDKELKKKHDQLKNKILEEEQKAREFHAKPVPRKFMLTQSKLNQTLPVHDTHNESMLKTNDQFRFKARPATVVHMKPFVPKKEEKPLTEITEFTLNTEQRAKERSDYEQRKHEREGERFANIQQEHSLKIQRELEEHMKQRKETEIRANPIRRYKEVKPVATKKLTSPKSPKFVSDRTKNKEN